MIYSKRSGPSQKAKERWTETEKKLPQKQALVGLQAAHISRDPTPSAIRARRTTLALDEVV